MFLVEAWLEIRDFVELGGRVLIALAVLTFWMWLLIIERSLYMIFEAERDIDLAVRAWSERSDHDSWFAHQIQRMLVSELRHRFTRGLALVRCFVALCPMLGLLGTVVGMLEVFDVMAVAGSSNVRGLASGVSQATFSTLAGMVSALSGLVASVRLDRWARLKTQEVAERLGATPASAGRRTHHLHSKVEATAPLDTGRDSTSASALR